MHHSVYLSRQSSPLFHSLLSLWGIIHRVSSSIASCSISSSLLSDDSSLVSIVYTRHQVIRLFQDYTTLQWPSSLPSILLSAYFLRLTSPLPREQSIPVAINCDFRSSFSHDLAKSIKWIYLSIFITDISCLSFSSFADASRFVSTNNLCGKMISRSCQRIQQWRIVFSSKASPAVLFCSQSVLS